MKILYNLNRSNLGSESYRSEITLEDRTAVDDAGGVASPLTVKARNASGDVSQLVANFLATMPTFSRPTMRITRSIDSRSFEEVAVGDVVLVNDNGVAGTYTVKVTTGVAVDVGDVPGSTTGLRAVAPNRAWKWPGTSRTHNTLTSPGR